jgi:hypothetical protein
MMLKRTFTVLLLVSSLLFVSATSAQRDKEPLLIFGTTFAEANSLDAFEFFNRNFAQLVNRDGRDVMEVRAGDGGNYFYITEGWEWEAYSATIRLRFTQLSDFYFGLHASELDCLTGYSVDYFSELGQFGFFTNQNCDYELLNSANITLQANVWYDFRFDIDGNGFVMYVDDVQLGTATSSMYPVGTFGMTLFSDTVIEVDLIRISELGTASTGTTSTTTTTTTEPTHIFAPTFSMPSDATLIYNLGFDKLLPVEMEYVTTGRMVSSQPITENGVTAMRYEIGEEVGSFYIQNVDLTDYVQEMRVRFVDPVDISYYVRVIPTAICTYGYTIDHFFETDEFNLNYFANDADCTTPGTTGGRNHPYPLALNQWYDVHIVADGNAISMYVDGNLVFGVNDSRYSAGNVGLAFFTPGMVDLQYVRLYDLSGTVTPISEPITSSSTPITSSGTNTVSGTVAPLTSSVTDYRATVAELQTRGTVPSGGSLLFQEPMVFAQGGLSAVPLASRTSLSEFVIGTQISLTVSGQSGYCALGYGVDFSSNSNEERFFAYTIENGILSYIVGNLDVEEYAGTISQSDTTIDLVMAVSGRRLSVFVDGVTVLDAVPISISPGAFFLAVLGEGTSRCEGRPYWVYQFS